jgi:hypothetical protein
MNTIVATMALIAFPGELTLESWRLTSSCFGRPFVVLRPRLGLIGHQAVKPRCTTTFPKSLYSRHHGRVHDAFYSDYSAAKAGHLAIM